MIPPALLAHEIHEERSLINTGAPAMAVILARHNKLSRAKSKARLVPSRPRA